MENDDKYLPELLAEKDSLDSSFTHAMKLLNAGKVDGVFNSGWGVKLGGDSVQATSPKNALLSPFFLADAAAPFAAAPFLAVKA